MADTGTEPSQEMTVMGVRVAAHYGDPEAEYRAMRSACALVDLSWMSTVRASGADHREYLNRRLSQKVDDMDDGAVLRATLLGAEGRMQADLELLADGATTLLLSTPASAGPALAALLDRYVFTEDARFADEGGLHGVFALVGPQSESRLAGLGIRAPGPRALATGSIAGERVLVWRSEIAAGATAVLGPGTDAFRDALGGAAGARAGFLAFDTVRIESGTPWWGFDLDETTIPLDANLSSAIHFDKGCYPGQETIAKITNLGHPARQLRGVVLDSEDPPPPRTALTVDGQGAGTLTSCTWSPRLGKCIGLAMMKWAHRAPGTRILAGQAGGVVVELPFP